VHYQLLDRLRRGLIAEGQTFYAKERPRPQGKVSNERPSLQPFQREHVTMPEADDILEVVPRSDAGKRGLVAEKCSFASIEPTTQCDVFRT
jgi:hypothetical protein